MGRLKYEDWVPKEDDKRFFRIEQTVGELEKNPICQEASSTLFWQVFFGLEELSAVIEFERDVQAWEIEPSDKEPLLAAVRKTYRFKAQNQWVGLDIAILNRIFNV